MPRPSEMTPEMILKEGRESEAELRAADLEAAELFWEIEERIYLDEIGAEVVYSSEYDDGDRDLAGLTAGEFREWRRLHDELDDPFLQLALAFPRLLKAMQDALVTPGAYREMKARSTI